MCGRVVIVWDPKMQAWVTRHDAALARDEPSLERFDAQHGKAQRSPSKVDAEDAPGRTPHYNVGPRWPVGVVVAPGAWEAKPDGGFVTARWGFPLPGARKDVFNTQVERAFESPMWRGAIGKRHAVMPVTGFYEWDHDPGHGKQPYFVTRADGEPMLLGAIVGQRHVKDPQHDERMLCASVVTTAPSATVATLHDRMPLILEPDEAERWLAPAALGQKGVLDLAAAVSGRDVVRMVPVGDAVNGTKADGPQLIEPVKRPARQGALF